MHKKALLVGINRYPDPGSELKGCINDVRLMEKTLREQYGFAGNGNVRTLTDARATTEAILDGLAWLADGAAPGDSLVFHYSGHGSQVPDRHGDEADGLDEILCPYDLEWDHPLTDDDLAAFVAGIPKGALLTAILDCCHSGTGLREPSRNATATARHRFLPHLDEPSAGLRAVRRFGTSVTKTNGVLLAACRDNQTSADAFIDGAYHGAHTYYLCRSLRAARWTPSYRELVSATGAALSQTGFDQVPQLEGPARLLSCRFLEPQPESRLLREPAAGNALPAFR
ncbi:MAG: caspase family protein [Verrucomicrobiota bacterium]